MIDDDILEFLGGEPSETAIGSDKLIGYNGTTFNNYRVDPVEVKGAANVVKYIIGDRSKLGRNPVINASFLVTAGNVVIQNLDIVPDVATCASPTEGLRGSTNPVTDLPRYYTAAGTAVADNAPVNTLTKRGWVCTTAADYAGVVVRGANTQLDMYDVNVDMSKAASLASGSLNAQSELRNVDPADGARSNPRHAVLVNAGFAYLDNVGIVNDKGRNALSARSDRVQIEGGDFSAAVFSMVIPVNIATTTGEKFELDSTLTKPTTDAVYGGTAYSPVYNVNPIDMTDEDPLTGDPYAATYAVGGAFGGVYPRTDSTEFFHETGDINDLLERIYSVITGSSLAINLPDLATPSAIGEYFDTLGGIKTAMDAKSVLGSKITLPDITTVTKQEEKNETQRLKDAIADIDKFKITGNSTTSLLKKASASTDPEAVVVKNVRELKAAFPYLAGALETVAMYDAIEVLLVGDLGDYLMNNEFDLTKALSTKTSGCSEDDGDDAWAKCKALGFVAEIVKSQLGDELSVVDAGAIAEQDAKDEINAVMVAVPEFAKPAQFTWSYGYEYDFAYKYSIEYDYGVTFNFKAGELKYKNPFYESGDPLNSEPAFLTNKNAISYKITWEGDAPIVVQDSAEESGTTPVDKRFEDTDELIEWLK